MSPSIAFSVNGLDLNLSTEDIRAPTDWCFHERRHTLVIHLEGQLRSMECEFSRGCCCTPSPRS